MAGTQPTKIALIADDDSGVRGMLGRLLRTQGWTIEEATDGCAVLEKLTVLHVDLLILDQRMPQLTGLEVLSVIRSSPALAELPVIIVTGASDPQTSQTMVSLGVTDYLIKPLRPEFVRQRLARIEKLRVTRPLIAAASAVARKKELLVVVDPDSDRRSLLKAVLGHRYDVIETTSATAALRASMSRRPSMYVLGTELGLMSPEFLARKLRERTDGMAPQVVLVAPGGTTGAPEAFDAIISQTSVPSEFSEQFIALFGEGIDPVDSPASTPEADLPSEVTTDPIAS